MSSKVNDQASSASTGRLETPLLGQVQPPPDILHDGPVQDSSSKTPHLQKNACLVCRRQKLRCDGETPSCGRCTRLNHECVYNESRRRSGPKRGYVKGLETRLAQVEELLKKYEAGGGETSEGQRLDVGNDAFLQDLRMQIPLQMEESLMTSIEERENFPQCFDLMSFSPSQIGLQPDPPGDESLWAMIELGVEEPLPTQEAIDELTQIYFTKIHPSAPIVHQPRFSAPKPPPSLRYAIFAHAACITPSYHFLHSDFHTLALKYANQCEVSATNRKQYINIHHVQAWILIALYEFKNMLFPNAWMTTGRAVRIAQMLGLHRLDGQGGLEVKRTLRGVESHEEKEERRRAFWMAFCMDRFAAVGTGWPLIVDERDIVTNLPCSDEAFALGLGLETPSISLAEAMSPAHASLLSPFAGCVVVASLVGRVFQHLHRPTISSADDEFWRIHRSIDNTLLNMSLYLPAHLRLPTGSSNPNTIFLNMSLQSAVICLHQAAIFKAEKGTDGGGTVVEESKERCLAAAMQVASIMKRVAHLDLSMLNVYTPFSLYVATRIFAKISKHSPHNEDIHSTHLFLLSALVAIRDTNPLAESYLIQLDLEGFGLSALQENTTFSNLAQSVASMGVRVRVGEGTEDSEWITFVSPLVRIVEQMEEGSPEEVISQPFRGETRPSDVAKGKMVSTTEEVVLGGVGVPFDLDTSLFEGEDGIDYLGGSHMSGYP
ncbi:hypothetical protein BDZ45DRAFT_656400 [Acephala macrosclerotiorum]|nr:hypothetical protein BDZ45DRAFT_656400 [Acephala macrosclerotiorum]